MVWVTTQARAVKVNSPSINIPNVTSPVAFDGSSVKVWNQLLPMAYSRFGAIAVKMRHATNNTALTVATALASTLSLTTTLTSFKS